MANSKYTAPNDFRAFCEALGETEASMCHHGIKGQKWGIRRFQNEDGSLTSEGKARSKQELKKALTIYNSKRKGYLKLKSTLKKDGKAQEAIKTAKQELKKAKKDGKAQEAIKTAKQELKKAKKDGKIKADIKKAKAEYKGAAKEFGKAYRKTRRLLGAEEVRLILAQHGQDRQDWSNQQLMEDHMNFMRQVEFQNFMQFQMNAISIHNQMFH